MRSLRPGIAPPRRGLLRRRPLRRRLLLATLLPALLALTASCGRYIVGGAGESSPEIVGIPPARVQNVSFQTAISDDEEPAVARLTDGSIVACQIVTPLRLGLTRFDDALHPLWSRTIDLPGPEPKGKGDFELPRVPPVAERVIRVVPIGEEVALLTYRRFAADSVALLLRTFDIRTGDLHGLDTIHRTRFGGTLRESQKRYRSTISPNGSVIACYMVSDERNGIQRDVDVHLFGGPVGGIRGKRIVVTGRSGRDSLRSVLVDDGGNLIVLDQDERNTITLFRYRLQQTETPERMTVKVTDSSSSGMRLTPLTGRIENDGTMLIAGPGRLGPYLSGCATVRIDLNKWSPIMIRYIGISKEMLGKLVSATTFERPTLRGIYDGAAPVRWFLLLEERIPPASAAPASAGTIRRPASQDDDEEEAPAPASPGGGPLRGTAGHLITIALDSSGLHRWLRGTAREARSEGEYVTSSVFARAGASGVFRIFYESEGELRAREYFAGNGAEMSPVPRRLISTGGAGQVLFPYTSWLGERELLLTVMMGRGEDMKLCRLELAPR